MFFSLKNSHDLTRDADVV